MSVLLLGFSSNLLINIILDYKYQRSLVSLSFEETLNAIIASLILLEGMRWMTRILDRKISWAEGVWKRLGIQLGLHLVFIVVVLNVLLISITFLIYGGFYELGDLLVINISVVSLTFFFTVIDTGIYFFDNWRMASKGSELGAEEANKPVHLTVGKSRYLLEQEKINYAMSKSGLVIIATNEQRKLPYSHSLDTLMMKLSDSRFFRANRQIVLNHSFVNRITPLDYGKILVELRCEEVECPEVIISRTRAASFRKWLKSHTT
ncbi:MAG: LytTR family DNA-binding domain-containing protein [Cyclobacteriaceae bacterium]